MAISKNRTVVGVFRDEEKAHEAVSALRQAGFRDEQISVVGQRRDQQTGETAQGSHAGGGAAVGAAAGAGIAGLWSLGATFGMIPGIGPILAVGPIAAALISAAGGAVAGGIIGSLAGMGIPEEEAKYYESEVKAGRVLVTVQADGRYDEAWSILERYGAYRSQSNFNQAKVADTCATASASCTDERGKVQVHEEKLNVQKTPVQAGEVRVHKEVHTEQKNIQVPVEREEVVIERRPASGRASPSDIRAGEEVRIPVREEQVQVNKENVVKEEVIVGKRKVQDTQQVKGEVRKEDVKVEKQGDVRVRETTKSKSH